MKIVAQLLVLLMTFECQAHQFSGAFEISPKHFIPNEGQVKDQRRHINSDVKYLYIDDGLNRVFLKEELMLNSGLQNVKVSLNNLLPGIYQITLQQKEHFLTGKFMKQYTINA